MIQLIVFNLFLVMCIQLLKLCIKINYVFDFLDNEEKEKYYNYVKNKYKILNNVDDNILKKIFIYPSFIIYLLFYKEYELNNQKELETLANELVDEINEEIIEKDLQLLYSIQLKIVLNIKTLDAYNKVYTSHNNN
jgi:hypothetical protein